MQHVFSRLEFKYHLDPRTADSIYEGLKTYMDVDPMAEPFSDKSYIVTSLYFDTALRDDYHDKSGGFLDRKKIRFRIYDSHLTQETKGIWLEKKSKYGSSISKKRLQLSHKEYELVRTGKTELILGSTAHDKNILTEITLPILRANMRPGTVVRYKRKPLVSRSKPSFRITFDREIEACKSDGLYYNDSMQPVKKGVVVMELKYSTFLPAWVGDIIERYGISRDTFSKYALSLEALHRFNPIPR